MGKLKEVCKGLSIKVAHDGHWICFESGGKYGMFTVENCFTGLVRDAIIGWVRKRLQEPEKATKTKKSRMDFGEALQVLKQGGRVAREGWNGKGLWLELQTPTPLSKMTLPYVYLNYPDPDPGCRVPWLASQTDMLGEDWELVEGMEEAI